MSRNTSVQKLEAPSDDALAGIRSQGRQMVAHKAAVKELADQIAGMEWGSGNRAVVGSSFSPQTRMAIAEFCRVTRAHPQRHVDILGGGPYLNAEYWAELLANHPRFVKYEQIDVSPAVEQELRDRAKRHLELSNSLEEAGREKEALDRRMKAIDLEEQADEIRGQRTRWSPRPTATTVVITRIHRFINAAPMEKIESGEVADFDKYVVVVEECNWAGGMGNTMASAKKWDPIGDADPGKTARTRSLRRAAVKSFSAWMEEYDRQISRAESFVEAEFEIVQEDRATLSDGVVSTAEGEPVRGSARGAKAIPTRGQPEPEEPEVQEGEIVQPEEEEKEEESFNRRDRQKALFATLNASGIKTDKARKGWAAENGFDRSTAKWSEDDFERAIEILMDPVLTEVYALAEELEVDLGDIALAALGKDKPEFLADYQKVLSVLRVRKSEDGEGPALDGEL